MGPTWGPPGSCRPQMGPMLAPWTLLSGQLIHQPVRDFGPQQVWTWWEMRWRWWERVRQRPRQLAAHRYPPWRCRVQTPATTPGGKVRKQYSNIQVKFIWNSINANPLIVHNSGPCTTCHLYVKFQMWHKLLFITYTDIAVSNECTGMENQNDIYTQFADISNCSFI